VILESGPYPLREGAVTSTVLEQRTKARSGNDDLVQGLSQGLWFNVVSIAEYRRADDYPAKVLINWNLRQS
jgi:hypothetical protein